MPRPSFLIVGGMKCGTTSLHSTLRQHPQIFMSRPKELHFFDRRYDKGWDWYLSHFTPKSAHLAWGESTPAYMYFEHSRARILEHLPETRIVAILRDPVSRAYSHYWHYRERGIETADTFEEGLRLEDARLRGDIQSRVRGSYVDRGRYIDQLVPFAETLGRERVHVLLLEDLIKQTEATVAPLLEFLGVDPAHAAQMSLAHSNYSGGYVRRQAKRAVGAVDDSVGDDVATGDDEDEPAAEPFVKPPMAEGTKAELAALFRPYNERLAEWLGRDLSHWA